MNEHDVIELGKRVAGALHRENTGPRWSRSYIVAMRAEHAGWKRLRMTTRVFDKKVGDYRRIEDTPSL